MIVKKLIIFSILPILFFPSLYCFNDALKCAINCIVSFFGNRLFAKNTVGVERVSGINGFINTKVTINQGTLVGKILKSRNGRNFLAFQGIPYAQPPINELRFQDPVPAKAWSEEFMATSEPERCLQKNVNEHKLTDGLIGKEDCLYLNVYTPKTTNKKEKLMPVMFWIPGRGFSSGHGGLSCNGPHYLLDKDVVVVSINYRLGILGFLSTEDEILPGNYGLKDQVLALQWVKDNIEKFGGDPNRVTIFGEGSGGASVGLHLLSPMSKGLFHKAIMESGSPLCRWAVSPPKLAKLRTEDVAGLTSCLKDPKLLVDCLRNVSAEKLVELQHNYFEWLMFPTVAFPPVVENCNNSKESFLCKYPLHDFVEVSDVPVLLGMSSGEGAIFAARMYDIDFVLKPESKQDFNYYIVSLLQCKNFSNVFKAESISRKVFSRYFPDGNMNNPIKAAKMINDSFFFHGINDMAVEMSSKKYYYVYNHVNEFSLRLFYGPHPKQLNAIYGDETISLFYIDDVAELQGEDLEISKLMVNMWTQFATTDELTIDGTINGVTWPIFDTEDMKYVLIQPTRPTISEKPYLDEYNFWNDLGV